LQKTGAQSVFHEWRSFARKRFSAHYEAMRKAQNGWKGAWILPDPILNGGYTHSIVGGPRPVASPSSHTQQGGSDPLVQAVDLQRFKGARIELARAENRPV
jgi:hypothetical protein